MDAESIESLAGMGPVLGAGFVVAAGYRTDYTDAGHLASDPDRNDNCRDGGARGGGLIPPPDTHVDVTVQTGLTPQETARRFTGARTTSVAATWFHRGPSDRPTTRGQ